MNSPSPNSGHPRAPSIAIVGATGAVGREMLLVLEQRKLRHGPLRAFASPRSAGQPLPYRGGTITVEPLDDSALLGWSGGGCDIALFAAGSGISKQWCPLFAKSGSCVIDNSSAFRMTPGVALVVPEVNPQHMPAHPGSAIIANPNCSTIILLVAITPLHRAFGIERVCVSTYQAASGAGAQGMDELELQTREVLAGRSAVPKVFDEPYAFNLFSHNSALDVLTGLNVEEEKMILETYKMWGDDSTRITATCIRVPVLRAHCESVNLTLRKPATLRQVRETLGKAPGLTVVDDRGANSFPTPLKATGGDDCLVGRIRVDPSQSPHRLKTSDDTPVVGFDLFIAGDQLRKGAALNAVQIAELAFPSLCP